MNYDLQIDSLKKSMESDLSVLKANVFLVEMRIDRTLETIDQEKTKGPPYRKELHEAENQLKNLFLLLDEKKADLLKHSEHWGKKFTDLTKEKIYKTGS